MSKLHDAVRAQDPEALKEALQRKPSNRNARARFPNAREDVPGGQRAIDLAVCCPSDQMALRLTTILVQKGGIVDQRVINLAIKQKNFRTAHYLHQQNPQLDIPPGTFQAPAVQVLRQPFGPGPQGFIGRGGAPQPPAPSLRRAAGRGDGARTGSGILGSRPGSAAKPPFCPHACASRYRRVERPTASRGPAVKSKAKKVSKK